MNNQEKRILAIDYGTKRIGIAISDPLQIFAFPLITLNNDAKLWLNIEKIFTEYTIEKIILGYPTKESGEKSSVTLLVDDFYIKLKEITNKEILLRDERYTSLIATERIISSVKSKKKRQDKSLIDKGAAAVILEEFLNEKK